MRDAVTTAMEVAGLVLLCVCAAVAASSLTLGLGLSGLVLVGAGILEGHK